MNRKAWAIAATALIVTGCDDAAIQRSVKKDLCEQSGEAAHYIAAKAAGGTDVKRIVGDVIAERKYPDLRDKDVAAIGGIVILSANAGMTPDQIQAKLLDTCIAPPTTAQ